MDPRKDQKHVVIIAGEASGDLHGAKLVKAMQKRNRNLFFCGIGGQALKEAGVEILVDASELAVVGITEVLSKAPSLLKAMAVVKRLIKRLHPDLLILIDFPDFNLHAAAVAKKFGVPILYYISPQVWAWRSGRVKKIRKRVAHVAVILPFEADFYRKHEIPVTFVGHPLLDAYAETNGPESNGEPCRVPVIGLLPGSRDREIARHLPVMLESARILSQRIEGVKFIVSLAPSVKRTYMEEIIQPYRSELNVELLSERVGKIFETCLLAVVASGTVTLEAAISGTPMVIIYKVSPISYWFGKAMIRVKHIGLVNLIAGKELVPELVQEKASPEVISDTVLDMLSDSSKLEELRNELLGVRKVLGGAGASERTADIAMGML